jgi:hypothetical protein
VLEGYTAIQNTACSINSASVRSTGIQVVDVILTICEHGCCQNVMITAAAFTLAAKEEERGGRGKETPAQRRTGMKFSRWQLSRPSSPCNQKNIIAEFVSGVFGAHNTRTRNAKQRPEGLRQGDPYGSRWRTATMV